MRVCRYRPEPTAELIAVGPPEPRPPRSAHLPGIDRAQTRHRVAVAGGQLTSAATGVSSGPNRIDAFARGTDGAIHYISYDRAVATPQWPRWA